MTRPTVLPADRSRLLKAGAVAAAGRLRPPVGDRRRRAVCGAARLLTGLGVRVAVSAPVAAWPRVRGGPGLLVVADCGTPLDPLVLLTVLRGMAVAAPGHLRIAGVACPTVPATAAGVRAALARGTSVVVRPEAPGHVSPELLTAAVDTGAAVCPVAVRYRGTAPAPAGRTLREAMRSLAAAPGTVVAVHLLPALCPAGTTPQELAAAVELAFAAASEPAVLSAR